MKKERKWKIQIVRCKIEADLARNDVYLRSFIALSFQVPIHVDTKINK